MAKAAPPRVLFIDQTGELGGAELSLLDLVRCRVIAGWTEEGVLLLQDGAFGDALRELGIDVKVVPFGAGVTKQAGMARKLLALPRSLGVIHRIARVARPYDVVYANTLKALVLGGAAAWRAGRPMVAHLHDIVDSSHFSPSNRRVVVAAMNAFANTVIANSQATADAYRRAGGKRPTIIAHNGIDPAPFLAVDDGGVAAVRCDLSTPADAPLIGVFGRLAEWKGQRVLLEALQRPGVDRAHLIVVGDALFTDEDRRYAAELREMSLRSSLRGRVHWLGHRSDIARLMRACDVIVHCSTQPEPFGRVIVEGMLAGRPVIAAAAGGALEIVRDGANALLTTPGDADALACAVRRVLEEPGLGGRLAAAGRDDALERFSLDAYAKTVDGVIEEAAAGRRSSPSR
ncbi:Mannosylfructose-phosphate synthase [Botrimarina colliarenosi]|uniref:Mannosylfructose-phosphate synthase n=1 Tax=Botrimarina colliarenosi TaxID=2528001 RepID=A0A5C6AFX6_9BACT|nr:glycosyltransferase family 4 protein [Botrimarina colliarenosi]TWT97961.1 Mannosylfructose-phosphate synthase [Botrimarina colliarenosi]